MDKFIPDDDDDLAPSDPLMLDEDGLYITVSQMRFWLNSKIGRKLFKEASPKFFSYYNSCRTYNLISDMIKEDPECAYLYWDSKLNVPAFSFPVSGIVSQRFNELGLLKGEDEDEDEDEKVDPYNLFGE
jgi:hypothetical protein